MAGAFGDLKCGDPGGAPVFSRPSTFNLKTDVLQSVLICRWNSMQQGETPRALSGGERMVSLTTAVAYGAMAHGDWSVTSAHLDVVIPGCMVVAVALQQRCCMCHVEVLSPRPPRCLSAYASKFPLFELLMVLRPDRQARHCRYPRSSGKHTPEDYARKLGKQRRSCGRGDCTD